MAHRALGRMIIRNALIAALITVPLALIVFTVIATLFPRVPEGETGFGLLLDLSVLFPWLALLAGAGSILFTLALQLAHQRGFVVTRWRAVLFAPLLLIPWLLVPARGLLIYPPLAAGVIAGLIALIMGAQLPTEEHDGRKQPAPEP